VVAAAAASNVLVTSDTSLTALQHSGLSARNERLFERQLSVMVHASSIIMADITTRQIKGGRGHSGRS
jgi:hypothetical protein